MKKSSTSSNLPLKSTSLRALFFEILRLVNIDDLLTWKNSFYVKSHLLCTKPNLITSHGKVEKIDIGEQCTQERQNTKWKFKLITNVTTFAALLKKAQWDVRTLSNPNLYNDIRNWTVFYQTKTRNHTTIICVFSAHWLCTWTDTMISTLTLLDAFLNLYQNPVMISKVFVEFK